MNRDIDRFAPWTGIAFVGLVLAGAFTAGSTPNAKASGARVLSFYTSHQSKTQLSSVLLTLSFMALVFFAGALRVHFKRAGADGLSAVLLVGAGILAAGQTINQGFAWALADTAKTLSPAAAQALNVASNEVVLASAAGWFVFASAAWLAILRTGALPVWLGWVSLAVAILVLTPLEFAGFLVFVVWVVAASVLTVRRWSDTGSEARPTGQPAPALAG